MYDNLAISRNEPFSLSFHRLTVGNKKKYWIKFEGNVLQINLLHNEFFVTVNGKGEKFKKIEFWN